MGIGDFKDLLEGLKERDPALYKQMISKLKKTMHVPLTMTNGAGKQGPVKTYTILVRKYTCRHCGYIWVVSTQLGKGDAASWTEGGVCKQIVIVKTKDEPLQVEADAMYCMNCPTFVRALDREVLEQKYMEVLRKTAFTRMQEMVRRAVRI